MDAARRELVATGSGDDRDAGRGESVCSKEEFEEGLDNWKITVVISARPHQFQ